MNIIRIRNLGLLICAAAFMAPPFAFGKDGGGGRNSSGGANGQSQAGAVSASNKSSGTSAELKDKLASQLGALNAAHASPKALARASANSRVGKIRAYYYANEAAKAALSAAALARTNLALVQELANSTAALSVLDPAADTNDYQAAVDRVTRARIAVAAAALTNVTLADAAAAAVTAALAAAEADAAAVAALELAATKEVPPELRAAVDRLLEGKFE